MKSRALILGKIRASLGVDADDTARRHKVEARLSGHPRGPVPARGQRDREGRIALFTEMAEAVNATVARVSAADEVPEAVAAYLRHRNLPQEIRRGADPRLSAMPWDRVPALEVRIGAAAPEDHAAVSHAFAGIAETGTSIVASGPDNPSTLNFLPDDHIIVVSADDILPDMESAWDRLRAAYGHGPLPRTLNMITGPSRSADIEQTLLLGAHGPRASHLIIVG